MLPTGKILKQNLRYVLFSDIYLKFNEPKTKRRAFAIIESAVKCFDRKGFDNVTLEMIAREAGVTRPSLKHYFKDMDEIRDVSLKYIRVLAQRLAVESMGNEKNPKEMLNGYLNAHIRWVMDLRVNFRVWLSFLSSCTRNEKNRDFNTKAVEAGTERLMELLEAGRSQGLFFHKNDYETARTIQTLMLGWLFALLSEEMKDPEEFCEMMKRQCLALLSK